jgi:ATP-binding cassette subfamily C protein
MESFQIFEEYGRIVEFHDTHNRILKEEFSFFLVEQGEFDLFFSDRRPPGQETRPRFLNHYSSTDVAIIPAGDHSRQILFSPVQSCRILIINQDDILKMSDEIRKKLMVVIANSLIQNTSYIKGPKPTHSPLDFNLHEICTASAEGDIFISNNDDVLWLLPLSGNVKLFGQYELPETPFFPVTKHLWYHIEKGAEYKVVTNLLSEIKAPELLINLIKFFSIIYDMDMAVMRKGIGDSIRQVYTSIESNKGHWNYSHDKLFEIVDPVNKEKESFTEGDPLMGCLKLIGDYEKITFKKPSSSNPHQTPLNNILQFSKVRSLKVSLEDNWYKYNNGAFLCFKKEDDSPVAMIPKGETAYMAFDYAKKTSVPVKKNNVNDYKSVAYTFFTPFTEKKLTGKSMIKFGFQFVKKELLAAVIIGSIGAIIALFIPIITGYIFDMVIPNSSFSELGQIFILLLTVAVSMGILDFAQAISVLRLEGKLNYKLQSAVWDRLLTLKVRFFHGYSAGDLTERSMGVEKIRGVLSGSVLSALISFIFSLFYLGLLFYYSVKLALVGLALGLTIVGFTIVASYYGFKHVMVIRYLEAVLSGFLFQVVNGINKIRTTNSEERVFSQWTGRYSYQKRHYAAKRKINVAGEVFGAFFPIFSAMFIFITVHQIMWSGDSDFTVGNFISFNNAFFCFQGALLQMSMATVPLLTIKPIFKMFKPIIDAETEFSDKDEDPGEIKGEITISHLSFKYEDYQPLILNDINLKIHQGEYIALVGSSGSGKSTLLRLLMGFEDPNNGRIFFDNKDMTKLDIAALRSQMGIVLQNGSLMNGTILYNIIGNSTLTEEDAWKAAEKAGCAHEINELPEKMYTQVKASESTLSGGQIQRITIARALTKNPKILFFDEATSALDNITQKIITNTLNSMNITRVIVAHRLSTIMDAHMIVALDKGKIVESGTYDELLKKGGFFSELVKRQFA